MVIRRYAVPPPVPQNVPGISDLATPLQSSHGEPVPSGLADCFIAGAPLPSISNRVGVVMQALAFRIALPGGPQLTQILRTTFPKPQPCSVVIGSDIPNDEGYAPPRRLAALDRRNNSESATDNLTGLVFVEWGVGAARERLWLDMAQGTLQLPVTSFVEVSAYVGGDQGESFVDVGDVAAQVSATVIPGHTVNADARYTARLQDRVGHGAQSLTATPVPPFARRFTFAGYANYATTCTLRLFDAAGAVVASYLMTLGAAPVAAVPDVSTHSIPLPGGVESFDMAFGTASAALQNASAVVAFEVAP